MTVLGDVAFAAWEILLLSAPYLFLGFLMAGLLKAFLPDDLVSKHFGRRGVWSVLKASIVGLPLPLCSCGVVPAAAGIRKQGASRGATAAFLVSTPETGVDSIAITYGLLGPLFTIVRPLAAFTTAAATGIAINMFDTDGRETAHSKPAESPECSGACPGSPVRRGKVSDRLKEGMRFAFVDLLKDTGGWFLLGIGAAALITVFLSPQIVEDYFENRYLSMALMLAVSVPLYVCATSSTPIAAAFLLKGVAPGSVLVFLLAGPATNAASIAVISRVIGKKATAIYLLAIVAISVLIGSLLDLFTGN